MTGDGPVVATYEATLHHQGLAVGCYSIWWIRSLVCCQVECHIRWQMGAQKSGSEAGTREGEGQQVVVAARDVGGGGFSS
jgi:hypothetical protein